MTASHYILREERRVQGFIRSSDASSGVEAQWFNSDGTLYTLESDKGFLLSVASIFNVAAGDIELMFYHHEIGAVDVSAETFTITGIDVTAKYPAGKNFVVRESTGNDGVWTVESVEFTGGNTVITVTGDITDITADGLISIVDAVGAETVVRGTRAANGELHLIGQRVCPVDAIIRLVAPAGVIDCLLEANIYSN